MLWITGAAGWGKTHLASFVVDQLRDEGHAAHVYFFPFDDERKMTPEACLLSLAYQQASRSNTLQQGLAEEDLRQGHGTGTRKLKRIESEELWSRLRTRGILHDTADRLYLVIDGLDECTDPNTLLDILLSWTQLHETSLRILLLSRDVDMEPMPDIQMLPMRAKNVRYDVGAMLNNYTQLVSESSTKSITALIRRLTQRSLTRTPLWASLAIKKLDECQSDVEFNHTLQSLPETAEVFFDEAVSAVSQVGDAQLSQFLAWVGIVAYPLEFRGLLELVKGHTPVSDSDTPLKQQPLFPNYDGLLCINSKAQIRFLHRVARDAVFGFDPRSTENRTADLKLKFAPEPQVIGFEPFSMSVYKTQMVHEGLSWLSMNFITPHLRNLQSVPFETQDSGDARVYALAHFPRHLALSASVSESLCDELQKSLEASLIDWVEWLTRMDEVGEPVLDSALDGLRAFYAHLAKTHPSKAESLHFLRIISREALDERTRRSVSGKSERTLRDALALAELQIPDEPETRKTSRAKNPAPTSLLTLMQGTASRYERPTKSKDRRESSRDRSKGALNKSRRFADAYDRVPSS